METSNKDAPSLTLGFAVWTTIRLFEPKAIAVARHDRRIARQNAAPEGLRISWYPRQCWDYADRRIEAIEQDCREASSPATLSTHFIGH
jgi:hypothetical protein